jgi:heparin/heparan-sulfate lyase
MKDAGHFGFFSRRAVVNLDGLVNGPGLQNAIRDRALLPLLRAGGVRYLVQHAFFPGDPFLLPRLSPSPSAVPAADYETLSVRYLSHRYGTYSEDIVLRRQAEAYRAERGLPNSLLPFTIWRLEEDPPPAAGSGSPALPPLRNERPRLFINPETLPAVRARARGDLRELCADRKKALDALAQEDLTLPKDYGMEAASAAFHYLCEGSSNDLVLATRLLESACAFYRNGDRSRRPVNWYAFSRIHALTAYDWLYDSMEPERRARLGRDLLDHVERNQPGNAPPPGANLTDHRSGLYGERALLWYAGIALKGAGIDEAKAELAIALGYDLNMKMLNYRQRVAGDDGGMATPTLGYALRATPWAEFNFFHTMKSAFGRDIAADWPHVARFPNYVLWNWLPGGREFGAGDTDHVSNRMQTEQIYSHCAQIRHFFGGTDPEWAAFAAWVQEQCPSHTYFTAASPIAPFLLTRLGGSPAHAAPPADLPLARHFAGLGQIFMRSGQGDDDTYALFMAGGCTEGIFAHRHYDQNTFTIFRGGFLAIDSGSRPEPGNHLSQYYGRSVAHNAVLIRMDGEVLPRYWGAAAQGEDALGVANDGGMCSLTGAVVRAFVTTPDYTYIASDATACYAPAKCRLATRQFIHLQPDVFVIFDRVSAVKPEYRKTWLLHTVGEPRIADSTFVSEQGEGRLFCRTLLPAKAALDKIGGPGKEFWSDGRNWPLPPRATTGQSPTPLRQTELMGGWRVEVAPSVPSQDDCFLHLIEVGGLEKTNMAPARLLQEPERAGVALTRNATTWSVRFRTRGELGADIAIERGTNMVVIPLPNTVQAQSGLARTGAKP